MIKFVHIVIFFALILSFRSLTAVEGGSPASGGKTSASNYLPSSVNANVTATVTLNDINRQINELNEKVGKQETLDKIRQTLSELDGKVEKQDEALKKVAGTQEELRKKMDAIRPLGSQEITKIVSDNSAGNGMQVANLCIAILCVLVICALFYFTFLNLQGLKEKKGSFSEVFKRLDELKIKNNTVSSNKFTNSSYSLYGKSPEVVGNEVMQFVKQSLDNLHQSLRLEMSTSDIANRLNDCKGKLEEISINCERFDAYQKTLVAIHEKHPDLVDLALTDAVKMLKECHRLGIASAEKLQSVYQTACDRNDFDAQLQATKQKLNIVEQQSSKTDRELQHSKELLALYRPVEFAAVQEKILAAMQGLQSDVVAAAIAQVLQFHWFVRSFADDESKIKSAFVRLDDNLYELVGNKQDQKILQEVRNAIEGYINTVIFRESGSVYSIMWPKLGALASEHADEWYSRENDTGNTICKVRSALIRKKGQVVSLARVYTCV